MHHTANQRGISHYIIVLAVVLVAVIGGAAVYLASSQKASAPAASTANTAAKNEDKIIYVPIEDWGVNLHLTEKIGTATIMVDKSSAQTKVLTTKRLQQLAAKVPECARPAATVSLSRVLPGEIVDGKTVSIDELQADKAYVLVSDYYYKATTSAICDIGDTDGSIKALQTEQAELLEHASHIMTPEEVEQGNHDSHEDHEH